jgi:hypothetical protein
MEMSAQLRGLQKVKNMFKSNKDKSPYIQGEPLWLSGMWSDEKNLRKSKDPVFAPKLPSF